MSTEAETTETPSPTKLSRRDIQNTLMPVVRKSIAGLGIEMKTLSNKPTERVIRAMLRAAARLAVDAGGKHETFLGMALTAFGDELYKKNQPKAEPTTPEATEGGTEDPTPEESGDSKPNWK